MIFQTRFRHLDKTHIMHNMLHVKRTEKPTDILRRPSWHNELDFDPYYMSANPDLTLTMKLRLQAD